MIWLDAHFSPRLAEWMQDVLGHEAQPIRDMGLRNAEDDEIFDRGREEDVTLMTKDRDFADMVSRKGSPPRVIWLRCGNTSEERLKDLLEKHLNEALEFLASGEDLVEIR